MGGDREVPQLKWDILSNADSSSQLSSVFLPTLMSILHIRKVHSKIYIFALGYVLVSLMVCVCHLPDISLIGS